METYCRIDLSKTNYTKLQTGIVLPLLERSNLIHNIKEIYKIYCRYKKFTSVVPLFDSIIFDRNNDVIGYFDNNNLVAFTIVKIYDNHNVESMQFAWNYENPKLRLGIKSIEHECAYYKSKNYKYLYLGKTDKYKTKFNGYEEIGTLE